MKKVTTLNIRVFNEKVIYEVKEKILLIIINISMLPIEKNKDVIEKINKLYQRIECLKESKFLFVAFLTKSQQLYGTQTKKIK